ncbi:hypothetical protein AK830_g11185 [Neonectria ditissima]|uniref:DNA/RNA-binding domain-containing protein n=1 Tax=Neonectria ditissima TaxID=78410 RepID=A0A0P7B206_9HYPO|nr:hypothetical protein AK830_g11185 [Neonectria ditissima]
MELPNDIDSFRTHVRDDPLRHTSWESDEDIENAFKSIVAKKVPQDTHTSPPTRKREADRDVSHSSPEPGDAEARLSKKRSSPGSVDQPESSPPVASSNRSRARQADPAGTFDRGPKKNTRQLWTEGDGTQSKQPQGRSVPLASQTASRQAPSNKPTKTPQAPSQPTEPEPTTMMLQPETRPISQDQLVAEVKGIYAGLVMVETKCIEVDNAQSSNTTDANKLNNEQWQALIALHRTLLHEHHDFFLASQHPSASVPLRRLASKYAMPARMWRHGIHSFLELLRHRLPASLEHMLTFLYLAYSMMALLYETVPAFEDTWIECLGDLGRYRMAIEDDDIRDREVWTGVSRHWYSKASDKSPTTGRLYHHLAILARPNALQQLYYYAKSLCVPIPFLSAKESVMTLFDPLLGSNQSRLAAIDAAFVRVHGILFSGKSEDKLEDSTEEFLNLLDSHISRTTKRWLESGYFIGIALGCSLLGYGAESNVLMRAMSQRPDETDVAMDGSSILEAPPSDTFSKSLSFAVRTYEIVICRWGDTNILPFIHTTLVFINHMTSYPAAMSYLEGEYPWKFTAVMLNYLITTCGFEPRMDGEFPGPQKDEAPRPLPEDYAMRGLTYAEDYHPKGWFINEKIDEDEKYFELASMVDERKERILYLGHKIAAKGKWLTFDADTRLFSVTSKYEVELDEVPKSPEGTPEQKQSP